MFGWFKRKYKIWVVEDLSTGMFNKVVSYKYPVRHNSAVGPFRSEVDAEEYCNRLNVMIVEGVAVNYNEDCN